MATYILLLRGINVSGKNIVKMADLREHLSEAGFHQVRTYIQSGNIVLSSSLEPNTVEEKVRDVLETNFNVTAPILCLTSEQLTSARDKNPFPDAVSKALHIFFLSTKAEPDEAAMRELATDSEEFVVGPQIVYLHTPDGFGRSKLGRKMERLIGVPATARNWNTIKKLSTML